MPRGTTKPSRPVPGDVFGMLTVVSIQDRRSRKGSFVVCRCSCGTEKGFVRNLLLRGKRKSCGCGCGWGTKSKYRVGNIALYKLWLSMRARCEQPRNKDWKWYGGRGIAVCERWRVFDNFYEDMGDRPSGMTLERIDNDKGYEPGNCRWATRQEQMQNRAKTIRIHDGERFVTASEIAATTGVMRSTIVARIKNGWPYQRVVSTAAPARERNRK